MGGQSDDEQTIIGLCVGEGTNGDTNNDERHKRKATELEKTGMLRDEMAARLVHTNVRSILRHSNVDKVMTYETIEDKTLTSEELSRRSPHRVPNTHASSPAWPRSNVQRGLSALCAGSSNSMSS